MKFNCPKCDTAYRISDDKIPDKGAYVTCKKCQTRISIKRKMEPANAVLQGKKVVCPECQQSQSETDKCFFCGADLHKTNLKITKEGLITSSKVTCPNCGKERLGKLFTCSECGYRFSKIENKADQDEDIDSPGNNNLELLNEWTEKYVVILAIMLFVGFIMPLFKYSLLFGESVIVFPWNLLGLGKDEIVQAATATLSEGKYFKIWTMLPVIVALVNFLGWINFKLNFRVWCMALSGFVSVVLMQIIYVKEAEVYGLMFFGINWKVGIIYTIIIFITAAISIANHLRKNFEDNRLLKLMMGIGGGLLFISIFFPILGSSGGWKAWSMNFLYFMLLIYSAMSIASVFPKFSEESFFSKISILAKIIIVWLPLACAIGQKIETSGFITYVIGSGGGFFHIFVSIIKYFLINYGISFTMAVGLSAIIELYILSPKSDMRNLS